MTLPIGAVAPALSGTDVLTNQSFSLQDHSGKVVLVAFSGLSWCPPCQLEAPVLQEIWMEHQNAGPSALVGSNCPEFQMVVVSVAETQSAFVGGLQQFGITVPGITVSGATISTTWDVSAVPPWDPMRNTGPAGRDALVTLAIRELAGEFADPGLRRKLGSEAAKALAGAAQRLADIPVARVMGQASVDPRRGASSPVPTRARRVAKTKGRGR